MDFRLKRLYEAAHAGDVYSLNELLAEDNLLLDRVVTTTEVNDNPLHIAATLGHAGFAREILRRKPKFAREFNSQHMSPLHLAAAQGHLGVAEELLQVDADLCYLQEKDGYLPVHIAVIKGRHDLVTLLVGKCEDSVNMPTYYAETVLHLAVKAKHSEIVEILTACGVTKLVLNAKDGNGNTILHLAFAGRQQKVIKHLLSQANIDVNSINSAGLSPLDVLLATNHEMGDLFLGEMLRDAGGKTAKELRAFYEADRTNSYSVNAPRTSQAKVFSTPMRTTSLTKSTANEDADKTENLIVVAALVATVTFAAALNPPGGSIQMSFEDIDRKNPNWFRNWKHMKSIYPQGSPVYLWRLKQFYIFDCFALLSSISVILLCLLGVAKNKLRKRFMVLVLWVSMSFMLLAFSNALSILLNSHQNTHFEWLITVIHVWEVFFILICVWLFVRAISIAIYDNGADKQPRWIKKPSEKVYRCIKWIDQKMPLVCIFIIYILVFFGIGWSIGQGVYVLN